jgi:alpha-tubulin suppressor-like RCC1 family protein
VKRRMAAVLLPVVFAACDPVAPGPVSRAGGFVSVAAGGEHTCGVTMGARLFCWGSNTAGQLGSSTAGSRSERPVAVTEGAQFVAASSGAMHTCAIDTDGTLYCWGGNARGQVGNGTRTNQSAPVAIAPERTFSEVSAGAAHTCAVTSDSRAFCWGAGDHGQTGATDLEDTLEPREVAGMRFSGISAGGAHTCALDPQRVAYCWGANDIGQLGDSTNVGRASPAPVFGLTPYIRVAAGYRHTCALHTDARAVCWGSNAHGELGEGGPPYEAFKGAWVPWTVQGDLQAISLTAGRSVTCIVTPDRNGWCWGRGREGQLGTGAERDYHVAHRVYSGEASTQALAFSQLSAGAHHVCGVTHERAIFCWGRGSAGQLGHGSMASSVFPVRVADGG